MIEPVACVCVRACCLQTDLPTDSVRLCVELLSYCAAHSLSAADKVCVWRDRDGDGVGRGSGLHGVVTGVRVAQIGRMPRLMSTLRSRYVETMLLAEQINHTTPTPPASAGSGAAAATPKPRGHQPLAAAIRLCAVVCQAGRSLAQTMVRDGWLDAAQRFLVLGSGGSGGGGGSGSAADLCAATTLRALQVEVRCLACSMVVLSAPGGWSHVSCGCVCAAVSLPDAEPVACRAGVRV